MKGAFKFTSTNLFHAMTGWGIRCIWMISVALLALMQLHVIPIVTHDPFVYLVLVVTLLLFISEILNEWRREMFEKLHHQSTALDAIQQTIRGDSELLTLEKSLIDLRERLAKTQAGEKVVIEHFGLDMTFAWDPIEQMIKDLPNLTHIEYRLLMMAADRDDLTSFDHEVRNWLASGRVQVEKIRNELATLQHSCQKLHRVFNYDLRTYAAVPFVHGLRIIEPFNVAYITLCRWDGLEHNRFRWGREEYRLVTDASLNGAQSDLLDVFNGNFLHYWNRFGAAEREAPTDGKDTTADERRGPPPPSREATTH